MTFDERAEEFQQVPARRCTVLHGSGEATVDLTAYCADRQRTVDIRTCADCSHVRKLPRSHDLNPVVQCRPPDVLPPAPEERDTSLASARRVRVREVMSSAVVCVRTDARAETVAALLVAHHIRSVPVVDADRRLLGIVSKTDLMHAGVKGLASKTASDVMTSVVHSLPDEAPLAYAIALMASDSLLEVPIVSLDAQVIGVVTANDVLRWVASELGYVIPAS